MHVHSQGVKAIVLFLSTLTYFVINCISSFWILQNQLKFRPGIDSHESSLTQFKITGIVVCVVTPSHDGL